MLRFLYQAVDANKKKVSAYVDATSVSEAREKLESQGCTEIEFLDDEFGARMRMLRKPMPGSNPAIAAEVEAKLRHQSGPIPTLVGFIKNNKQLIAAFAILAVYGAYTSQWRLLGIGIVGIVLLALVFHVRRISSVLYDQILRKMALGEWNQSLRLIERLEKRNPSRTILFDLAIRRANIEARKGKLKQAVEKLEVWRDEMNDPKGKFPGRLASVYVSAGDYEGFIEQMRLAYEAAPKDRSRNIDYALALARFGDIEAAEKIINSVNLKDLPRSHLKFVGWTKGVIYLRKGEIHSAIDELSSASRITVDFADKPAHWPSMALINGTLALALARSGDKKRAKEFIRPIHHIFSVCADRELAKMIEQEVVNDRHAEAA